MGAGHTISATLLYPGFFQYICPLSNGISFGGMNFRMPGQAEPTEAEKEEMKKAGEAAKKRYDEQFTALKKAGYKLYFLACGESDFLIESARTLDATLTRNGLKHEFFVNKGGHTWSNWRIYLNNFAPKLFQ